MSIHDSKILSLWRDELLDSVHNSKSQFLGVFTATGELLYANECLKPLIYQPEMAYKCFVNPGFSDIVRNDSAKQPFIDGYITLGWDNYGEISIKGKIFFKNNQVFVCGSTDVNQLNEEHRLILKLNKDISNLQRTLIKEKFSLESANKKLRELNATKDKFFSIISHDLRNPFHNLLYFFDYLKEDMKAGSIIDQNGNLGRMSRIASNSTTRTFNLLENLLTWARSQTGKIQYNPTTEDLKSLSDLAVLTLDSLFKKKEIRLHNFIPEETYVYADGDILGTILRNLLSNAIKFTPKGAVVGLGVKETEISVDIYVKDNGVGMSKDELDGLFSLDTKSQKGTEGELGTGLGLVLCKDFVAIHSGKIWAESQKGKGSTFWVSLPKKKEQQIAHKQNILHY